MHHAFITDFVPDLPSVHPAATRVVARRMARRGTGVKVGTPFPQFMASPRGGVAAKLSGCTPRRIVV
jgi:hypothetical protein